MQGAFTETPPRGREALAEALSFILWGPRSARGLYDLLDLCRGGFVLVTATVGLGGNPPGESGLLISCCLSF